jgi:hypothetical protein
MDVSHSFKRGYKSQKYSIKTLNLYKGSCYFSQFALTFNIVTKAPNHGRELSLGIVQA